MEKSCKTCGWGIDGCIEKVGPCISFIHWKSKQPNKPIEPVKKLVVIPKNVAEAIEKVKEKVDSDDLYLSTYTEWSFLSGVIGDVSMEELISYFNEHPHTYIYAIQEGYQVEKTPKEQILE